MKQQPWKGCGGASHPRVRIPQSPPMCYLCLADQFRLEAPKSKTKSSKERALEVKKLLKLAEEDLVCSEGDKVVEILKEEQYRLSREI